MKLEFASIRAGLRADLRSEEVSARADAITEEFLVYMKARMRDGAEAGEFNRLADEFLATYPNHSRSEPVPYEPTGFMAGPADWRSIIPRDNMHRISQRIVTIARAEVGRKP